MLAAKSLPATRLFTVNEYYRMSELGILTPDERTELVDGEIILMAAKNPSHSRTTKRAYDYLFELLKNQAVVRSQEPVYLSDRSLPEPDIAIVRLPEERYGERHPSPEDIYWLIEVSDTTLHYDLNTKSDLYAQANINEYWVLDVVERCMHLHQKPFDGVYKIKSILAGEGVLLNGNFLGFSIDLSRLFLPN